MHKVLTINPYFHIDFCEYNTRTILPASIRLTEARPNYQMFVFA